MNIDWGMVSVVLMGLMVLSLYIANYPIKKDTKPMRATRQYNHEDSCPKCGSQMICDTKEELPGQFVVLSPRCEICDREKSFHYTA